MRIKRLPREKAVPALYAQLLLHKVLQAEVRLPAESLKFGVSELGKPYLKNLPEVQFNYSHTDSAVALALSSAPVGVDVERIRHVRKGLTERFFAQSEREYAETSEIGRDERLIEIWTKKEAYVKLLGIGLSFPLQAFSVLEEPLASTIKTYKIDGNYLSVCTSAPAPIRFIEKNQAEIEFI